MPDTSLVPVVEPVGGGKGAWTAAEKAVVKALWEWYRGPKAVEEVLEVMWGRSPTAKTMREWARDPEIVPDAGYRQMFHQRLVDRLTSGIGQLVDPLVERALKEIEGGSAQDVFQCVKALSFIGNTIGPPNAAGFGGGNVYQQYVDARGSSFDTVPWGRAEDE